MSGTILLADDSLTIQKVVELTFADTDYRVIAVASGDDLLDRLEESKPDLIICDVIMPGKDGYEVCQQIKSSSDWLHLPVILLTGTFEPFDRDRAIAAGCSEIITKPFEARKLVDTVERLIGGPDVQTPQTTEESAAAPGGGDDWTDEGTPVDVPVEESPEEFGTQLAATAKEEDGIEFTTSGFAEMEAAGRSPEDGDEDDDGLEYEFGVPGIADEDETAPSPSAESSAAPVEEDPSAKTVRIDVSSFREEPAREDDEPPVDEPSPVAESAPETDASAETSPGPFEATDETPAEPEDDGEPEAEFQDEPSMADTSPVEPPPEDDDSTSEAPGDAAVQLSDEDVDRIARRVIDLASDRIDQIVWEVVPDMAEVVVRQRIRELEAETDAGAPDPVQ
jgi:CheY-like chemotaxis protein